MGRKARSKIERKEEQLKYELMTIRESADYLKVHPDTIRNWIRQNKINYLLLDTNNKRNSYRIDKKELDKLIKVG